MDVELSGVIASDKTRTTAYLAIVEAIVNSIQSIEETGREDGNILVELMRSGKVPLDLGENALPSIESVLITDNGSGFNNKNRKSFGTLFSKNKSTTGGKGYGRITFLKHFQKVFIESTYNENEQILKREFIFEDNFKNDNLDAELIDVKNSEIHTLVKLSDIKNENALDKKLDTVARKLVEMLLPYFLLPDYNLPKITIRSEKKEVVLNDLINNNDEIIDLGKDTFKIEDRNKIVYSFTVRIFKIFFPSSKTNMISLVAHNREVIETNLSEYITEFSEPFIETNKTFIVKAYVIGDYLNANVTHHRAGFDFGKSSPTLDLSITQNDIEKKTSEIIKKNSYLADNIETRSQAIRSKVKDFVNDNPWHKSNIKDLDYNTIPLNPSEQDMEVALHKLQYEKERTTKAEVSKILENTDPIDPHVVDKLVSSITEINKDELAKYVSHRKLVIEFLKKSLEVKEDAKYSTEDLLHNLIYPKNTDSDQCEWDKHNLWLLDERLTFTQYVTSDKKHIEESKDRSDILIFDKPILYRSGDDAGNPVTIFELKRPQRFDYLNESSKEDPVAQVLKYCQQIKTNTLRDNSGLTVTVHPHTPFYAYIVSDINGDVEAWLKLKNFNIMPDGGGWYYWHGALNLYVEFIGWKKVWKDAEMRNKIFFQKLGLVT